MRITDAEARELRDEKLRHIFVKKNIFVKFMWHRFQASKINESVRI